MLNVAINGFGWIGRTAFKTLDGDRDLRVVAISDLPLSRIWPICSNTTRCMAGTESGSRRPRMR
jgi:glyceraldehyde-3-phosphate dehydrogenase/erythrose-4-phosphate dehydrogenase